MGSGLGSWWWLVVGGGWWWWLVEGVSIVDAVLLHHAVLKQSVKGKRGAVFLRGEKRYSLLMHGGMGSYGCLLYSVRIVW